MEDERNELNCVCSISDSESHFYKQNNEVATKHSGRPPQDINHSQYSH